MSISETDDTTATQWLDKYNWKLENAINAFLSNGGQTLGHQTTTDQVDPRLEEIFNKYADEADPEIIGIDGTLRYLDDLQFDPEHFVSLVLAYILESPSMGVFSKRSFCIKWRLLGVTSLEAMRKAVVDHEHLVKSSYREFEKVYKFTFDFIKTSANDKLVDSESAVAYWKLMFPIVPEFAGCGERLQQWYTFVHEKYQRGFSKDSWVMFLQFVNEIVSKDPDNLSGYDEMSSWPSVVDEYIEYLRDEKLIAWEEASLY